MLKRAVNARPHALRSHNRGRFDRPLHKMSAAPHYGLRYGSAPATGNFQRLRGRPPLVSPLKSCMGCSFTAVTMPAMSMLRVKKHCVIRSPQKSPQNTRPGVIFNDLRCRPCVPSHCKYVLVTEKAGVGGSTPSLATTFQSS